MKKLLIVDDDPHLLESLCAVFFGIYGVFTASSAEQAAALLTAEPVDVMLLDVVLPGMGGIEFLQNVRSEHPDLPVVMLSGMPSIRPVMRALELGACDYIRKPFDVEELRLVVGRALKTVRLQQRVRDLEHKLSAPSGGNSRTPLKEAVEAYEREIIQDALRRNDGVQTRAAEDLGTTRRILRYRIEKLHID